MKRLREYLHELTNALRVGWFLAVRQLRRSNKWTTGLIMFIMVLTFLNLVVVSGLLLGLISGSFVQFKDSYSGDLLVTSAPSHDFIENSPALLDFLETHPYVVTFVPRHAVGVTALGTLTDLPKKDQRKNQLGARLVGMDTEREIAVTGFPRFIMKGEMLREGEDGYILVGATLIKKYSSFADANIPGLDLLEDVDIGSKIRISVPRKDGEPATKDFIIKGIVKSKVDELSTRMFVLDSELKRMLATNREQVQEIAIRVEPGKVAALKEEIIRFMDGYAARVQTSEEAIPSFLRDIETTMGVLGNALSSFALIVATITIFIVIFINAVTKRKFIGIMKGIGVSPMALRFSYVFQAMFYGISGSAIGLAITFGFLKPYFDANPINFPFSDGILVATPEGAAVRICILLVVTLLAGYIPAAIIVRKNTLDSILGR
jgi:ABC-type lipoprotein release transport system permease subunit